MFRFFTRGKDKAEWAALAFSKVPSHPENIPEEQLRAATGIMIAQHKRIILESAEIVRTTQNRSTRAERLELCKVHYQEILKLERFADQKQKEMIKECASVMTALE